MIFLFWVLFVIAAVFQFPFAFATSAAPHRGWFYLVMLAILGVQTFGFPH
jgi:hypothetical protein